MERFFTKLRKTKISDNNLLFAMMVTMAIISIAITYQAHLSYKSLTIKEKYLEDNYVKIEDVMTFDVVQMFKCTQEERKYMERFEAYEFCESKVYPESYEKSKD